MNSDAMSFNVGHDDVKDAVRCIVAPTDTASSFISKIQEDIIYDLEAGNIYVIEFPHNWYITIKVTDKFSTNVYSNSKSFADMEQFVYEQIAKCCDSFISELSVSIRKRI